MCENSNKLVLENKSINGFVYEFKQIAWRTLLNIKRMPILFKGRLIQTIILAFICGNLYWKLSKETTNFVNISNRFGCFFFIAVN